MVIIKQIENTIVVYHVQVNITYESGKFLNTDYISVIT